MPPNQSKQIEALRQNLKSRLHVLKLNEQDRGGDNDVEYEQFYDNKMKNWLKESKDGKTSNVHREEEFVYLFISSTMRDKERWPNSAQFQITLNEEIDNVIKAEIIQASLPLIDSAVHDNNHLIRYSFAPHNTAAIREVLIPNGNYQPTELALEIQTQLNLDRHNLLITSGAKTMDFEIGYVVDGTGAIEPTIEQFKVRYLKNSHGFSIQNVDNNEVPLGTTDFALHVKPFSGTGILREQTDDIYKVIGIHRSDWIEQGTLDVGSNTYYIVNTSGNTTFGDATGGLDARFEFSLHSNIASETRGSLAVVLDIEPLNDNDIIQWNEVEHDVNLGDFFGFVILPDPSFINSRTLAITSNSYPVRKHYKERRSRVKNIKVTHRRTDGTIMNYRTVEHVMVIRLTCSRASLEKPMFVR